MFTPAAGQYVQMNKADKDLPLLLEWLNRPHLQKWWRSGEMSPKVVQEKYLPRIFGADDTGPFFAYIDEEPVGYIQYYMAAEGNKNWRPPENRSSQE